MNQNSADVTNKRHFSPLWILPSVALAAGLWIVIHGYMTQGPRVSIAFETAEGLVAGKTKVKYRSLDVGVLEVVELNTDMSGVMATAALEPQVADLLRDDTQFWVVRARIGKGGLSGLGTILSGAYIQMAPGNSAAARSDFVGLEEPPPIPSGTPGLRITLISDRDASLSSGDPLFFKGLEAGRIESTELDLASGVIRYSAFIDAPYDQAISSSTRFWNTSGITLKTSAQGIELDIGSLESILAGGAAFENVAELGAGESVAEGAEFRLLASRSDVAENPYEFRTRYVLEFDSSVAGLARGAPVYFRGILVGEVERLLVAELAAEELSSRTYGEAAGSALPVLIYLEPARFEIGDDARAEEVLRDAIAGAVENGLRATMHTSNLLSGQKAIDLDFFPSQPAVTTGQFKGFDTIPTVGSGLNQIQQRIEELLAKIEALPLDTTVDSLNAALLSVNTAVSSFDQLLNAEGLDSIPRELDTTLAEFREVLDGFSPDSDMYQNIGAAAESLERSLDNVDRLTRKLSDRPSSLISSPPIVADPKPEPRP